MRSAGRLVQVVAACSASFSLAVHGVWAGWMSPILPKLQADDSPIPITPAQGSWIASLNSITTLAALLAVPYSVDVFGRKTMLAVGALPHIILWLMVAFADSYGLLLAASIVGSFGSGVLCTVCSMYLAEIAEAKIRGALSALFQVMLNGGILFAYCTAPFMSVKGSALLNLSLPVLLFLTIIWMPESPYFLMLRGREKDAIKELLKLRGSPDVELLTEEIISMRKAIQQQEESRGSIKDLFLQRGNRRTLLIVSGLALFQGWSGAGALLTYAKGIFQRSGTSLDADVCAIVVGCVQLVMSVASSALVDHVGRRPLMIGSFVGCAVSQAAVAVYFFLAEEMTADVSALYWLPLTGLVAFQISFCLGIGSVVFIVVGEIFHVSVKGLGSTVVVVVMTLTAFLIKKLFQVVADTLGSTYNFSFFALMCVCGAVYTHILLPETKGKTFAEINDEMITRSRRPEASADKGQQRGDIKSAELEQMIT